MKFGCKTVLFSSKFSGFRLLSREEFLSTDMVWLLFYSMLMPGKTN